MEFSTERIIKLADAQSAIPTRDGKLYAELFTHGTLAIEIYAPKGKDMQQPHTRDELYVVAAGLAGFLSRGSDFSLGPATHCLPLPERCIVLKISLKTC